MHLFILSNMPHYSRRRRPIPNIVSAHVLDDELTVVVGRTAGMLVGPEIDTQDGDKACFSFIREMESSRKIPLYK